MLFNSVEFAFFLPLVFILYWFVFHKNLRIQNILLLVSSYVFYGWWDYRFLFLLFFSTFLDYFTGLKMFNSTSERQRRFWFWLSIAVNLGFLGFFKYYNFFIDSFADLLRTAGFQPNIWTLQLVLPVGISFYTFHGMSYVIDIYKKRIEPTTNFVDYAVFVSFFPLLVAGPIERATHLLPQIQRKRTFSSAMATDGMRQILWGLVKKIVIADNCATYATEIFNNYQDHSGSTLLLGAVFFSFQIYGDFSGYSDIALGVAKLFGIDLLRNFAYPYFSRDIAEFWRRWHISLTTWFRDYVYIPLGGSKGSRWMQIRNTFIIFLLSGFWHGANWTFLVWGFLNALYFIPLLLTNKNRKHIETVASSNVLPSFKEFINILITFLLVTLAWIFFRSQTLHQAFAVISEIFSPSVLTAPEIRPLDVLGLVAIFLVIEWLARFQHHALQFETYSLNRPVRWVIYYVLIASIFLFGGQQTEFIYFQF
jgi:alginate O-acetyltransferase complex protein AlgI